jgi:hypothetical protein
MRKKRKGSTAVLPSLEGFNFEAVQKEAIEQLKAGKSLTGRNGVLPP